MQPKASRVGGSDELEVLFQAVNLLVEAHLESSERRGRRVYLGAIAKLLNDESAQSVVGISQFPVSPEVTAQMRLWLRERLSVWLARYGG